MQPTSSYKMGTIKHCRLFKNGLNLFIDFTTIIAFYYRVLLLLWCDSSKLFIILMLNLNHCYTMYSTVAHTCNVISGVMRNDWPARTVAVLRWLHSIIHKFDTVKRRIPQRSTKSSPWASWAEHCRARRRPCWSGWARGRRACSRRSRWRARAARRPAAPRAARAPPPACPGTAPATTPTPTPLHTHYCTTRRGHGLLHTRHAQIHDQSNMWSFLQFINYWF